MTTELDKIREDHAPEDYEFPTNQTYCRYADLPTDACQTCQVIADYDALVAGIRGAVSAVDIYAPHQSLDRLLGDLGDLLGAPPLRNSRDAEGDRNE